MSANSAYNLFEAAQSAPTELSRQQVAQLITTLPLAGQQQPFWKSSIYLNTIAMTTILSIAAYLLYSVTTPTLPEEPAPEINQVMPAAVNELEINPETVVLDTDSIVQTKSIFMKVKTDNGVSEVSVIQKITVPAGTDTTELLFDQEEALEFASDQIAETNERLFEQNEDYEEDMWYEGEHDHGFDYEHEHIMHECNSPCDSPCDYEAHEVCDNEDISFLINCGNEGGVDLSKRELTRLKKQLTKLLLNDNYMQSRKDVIEMVYLHESLWVDSVRIDDDREEAYFDLFDLYDIDEEPHRRLKMGPRQIWIGDFKDGYFIGSAYGKNIAYRLVISDLKVKEDLIFNLDN